MLWLEKLLNCRSYYFRKRILSGNITIDIFFNDFKILFENNQHIELDLILCDQAFLTAQRCARKQRISHTTINNLLYENQFQAEYIFGCSDLLDATTMYNLLEKNIQQENELVQIRQLGLSAATTADQSRYFYVLRIYPVSVRQ